MASLSSLRSELDNLKKLKAEAQRNNHAQAMKYKNLHRSDQNHTNNEELNDTESSQSYSSELPSDPMDWTAAQWAKYDKPQMQSSLSQSSGYKDMTGLAYATYAKETAKRTIDLEKYEKHKLENRGNVSDITVPDPENVDAIVKGLKEASERKQKRRTGDVSDKQYVNEKNRQFNMKLDREYGGK